ncbi:MAG TPA: hypothetical protein VFN56_04130 [Candidatus Saccharimonadales bacterium]|nr:hypothetical protein [Candidatus Saccharimonadales bacterium]
MTMPNNNHEVLDSRSLGTAISAEVARAALRAAAVPHAADDLSVEQQVFGRFPFDGSWQEIASIPTGWLTPVESQLDAEV